MHILRLSTLALGLTAVLGLLVGWSSPALAHCKSDAHNSRPGHDGCGDDGGKVKTGTTYSVVIEVGTGDGKWVVTGDDCEGFTSSGKLHVTFPAVGCETPHVMIGVGDECCTFWVYSLDVRPNKEDVQFFMTDVALVYPDVQPSVYNHGTDVGRLPWKRTNFEDGSFQLKVDLKDQYLTKIHDPGRGDMVGPIAIGNIVYTPIPPPE